FFLLLPVPAFAAITFDPWSLNSGGLPVTMSGVSNGDVDFTFLQSPNGAGTLSGFTKVHWDTLFGSGTVQPVFQGFDILNVTAGTVDFQVNIGNTNMFSGATYSGHPPSSIFGSISPSISITNSPLDVNFTITFSSGASWSVPSTPVSISPGLRW